MLPALAVSAGALTARIATMAKSAGPTLGIVMARLRQSAGFAGKTADDLIKWVRANPLNATTTAFTIGSVGGVVTDLFDSAEGKAAAQQVTLGVATVADYVKIDAAGEVSTKLDLNIAERSQDLATAREILRWARQQYGSPRAAVRAHRLQQAFFEMPLDDVQVGFDTLAI